ncbi:hypothetical protein AB0F68_06655 [Micromonospora sp. NPDC023966]|uniref:hypothetical protein n=1 Tax=Micromonospora sp. NPDC023966 TaxID=3154699 RepID=UPI0033FDE0DC
MTPEQLLDEASTLLHRPSRSMRRCWQRGCACLTRVALEQGLRICWDQVAPSLIRCPMRHQLLALPAFVDASTALLARTAWHGLSRAMHHHVYELAPTVSELEGWHRDVTRLLPQLRAMTLANNTTDSD